MEDLDIGPSTLTEPTSLVDLNGKLLFSFQDARLGRELFVSDGTVEGTHLLVDINKSTGQGSFPANLTAIGDFVYFSADDGIAGAELWRTDGTAAGTMRVADATPNGSTSPYGFTALPSGEILFLGDKRVYRTDGTATGTTFLKELGQIGSTSISAEPVLFNNHVYFINTGVGGGGGELWRSDGTESGTVRIETLTGTYPMQSLKVVGDRLFFTSDYRHIYCTDGSPGGAIKIDTLGTGGSIHSSGVRFGHVTNATAGDGFYYFTFGKWLCKADANDTYLVRDFTNAATGSNDLGPMNLVPLNDKVYFTAIYSTQSTHNRILWSTDGTAANTLPIVTSPGISDPKNMIAASGRLWFVGYNSGESLYTSDGTAGGTLKALSLTNGSQFEDSLPRSFTASGNSLFFACSDYDIGWALWRTSLSQPGPTNTAPIKDLDTATSGAGAVFAGNVNGKTIYFASNGSGYAVRYTDGTPAGTGLLKGIFSTPVHTPSNLIAGVTLNNHYYFASRTTLAGTTTNRLWRTDGTPGGTAQVGFNFTGQITSLVTLGNRILITMSNEGPYITDGLQSFSRATTKRFTLASAVHNGVAYGLGSVSATGTELWRSDGTDAGTYPLADIYPGSTSSSIEAITVVGNKILFFARPSSDGSALHKLDIATESVSIVQDVQPFGNDYYGSLSGVGTANGLFYFASSSTGVYGIELYVSDGTPEGTKLVKDINPGSASSLPYLFIPFGNGVLFRALSGDSSTAWYSDGTEAGTRPAIGIAPKAWAYHLGNLHFIEDTPAAKVWRTDGTQTGTNVVVSLPTTSMLAASDHLLVAASDRVVGEEVWSYRAGSSSLVVQGARFIPNRNGGQIRINTNRLPSALYTSGQPTLSTIVGAPVTLAACHCSVDSASGEFVIDLISTTGVLAEGRYRLTLPAGLFTDADLDPLADAFTFDVPVMKGDATGDGNVNFDDLLIVAQNYGQSGRTFRQGDFDFSGTVDFDDLLIVAQRYGTSLSTIAKPSPSAKRRSIGTDLLA